MGPDPIVVSKLDALADVPHAIPYQGSKRILAHAIVRLIPTGTTEIVEPFAGSAAISIAVRHANLASTSHISDINDPLMALWAAILAHPDHLADQYEGLWKEQLADPRSFYVLVREKFNRHPEPRYLLYLLARCVKAAVRYSKNGQFNQSADQRRLGAKPAAMRERILRTSRALQGSRLSSGDYSKLLLEAGAGSVVYMDPPYQGVTNVRDHRYMRGLPRGEFEEVLREAINLEKSFVISYDVVTDDERYGAALSAELGMLHLHIAAGRSSQATLQGIDKMTIESLYLSPAIVDSLGGEEGVRARLGYVPHAAEARSTLW